MKYYRNAFSQLKIYVTTPMNCTSKFSSYLTMISNFFIIILQIQQVLLNWNCCSSSSVMIKFLCFKVFFHDFFAIFILLKNCFNKFICCIFISKNNNWLTKSIINTNKFVSKTVRNVFLILFWIRPIDDDPSIMREMREMTPDFLGPSQWSLVGGRVIPVGVRFTLFPLSSYGYLGVWLWIEDWEWPKALYFLV